MKYFREQLDDEMQTVLVCVSKFMFEDRKKHLTTFCFFRRQRMSQLTLSSKNCLSFHSKLENS